VAWPYAVLLFILIVIPVVRTPVILDRKRQNEAEAITSEKENLSKELADRRKVKLSVSLKTEPSSKPLLMKMSTQFSTHPIVTINVSEMTLVIYNQGEKSVRLRKYNLWKLAAVEASQENNLHDMVNPSVPANVDVTEPLLHVISGQAQYDLDSLLGTCRIRVVVTYLEDSKQADSEPQDFQITCERAGGGAIKIIADEIGCLRSDVK
jgi:hypothetical protein